MNIDWHSIRPLNGGSDKGFEEFCSQLARAEVADCARFIRKGNPDAGVECYAIYENGFECAWQAKYFFSLGDSQWQQIDESVCTAIQKHPKLTRYVICLPMDLPDARVHRQVSALAKWNAHVVKWEGWAADLEMMVEFEYWGSSELLERLTRPEYIGRIRYWFDTPGFDEDWFTRRFEEARQTAEPRYTPEVHVDLPIAERFEAFGRTTRFFHHTVLTLRDLANAWRQAYSFGPSRLGKERDPEVEAGINLITSDAVVCADKVSIGNAIDEIVAIGSTIDIQPSGTLPFGDVATKITEVEASVDSVVQHLLSLQTKHRVISQYRYQFENFAEGLRKVREMLLKAQCWGGATVMIVQGQAGTGKTHLLCDITHRRLSEGRPTVLLMGQSFTSDRAPWSQATDLLDVSEYSAEEFVGTLECAAQAAGVRALVLIDALNEGKGPSIWPMHLSGFLAHFARSEWIGVVLAIRSSYDNLIPERVRENAVIETHRGFGERSYDAMRTFFTHYGLELPSTPPIAPEFDNPLFLKMLCLGLQGKGTTRLGQRINGVTRIFEIYLSSINKRVASRLDLSPRNKVAEIALRALVAAFPALTERWLAVGVAEDLVNRFLPGRPYEESLYRILIVEGVLVEDATRTAHRGEYREIVFIAYDRLADHLLTEVLLDTHFDHANAVAAFEPRGRLREVVEGGYETQGILEALCIQLPERTGREVTDLVPSLAEVEGFESAFGQSLVWRELSTFSERTCEFVRERLEQVTRYRYSILDALLALAVRPEHPLNARFLDDRLREDEMAARDAWWSVYLQYATSRGSATERLRDWALAVSPTTKLDDELVYLCAVALAWMLAASNRPVRDQATKALVNLLTGRFDSMVQFVEGFSKVDDTYIVERVYAVAYGVATRSHEPDEIKQLAECVYAQVFTTGSPPANILLRDYARGVVERALFLGSQIDVDVVRIRPPYASPQPVFPSEADVESLLPSPDHNTHKHEGEGEDWARNHIGHSVLEGELHRVIWEKRRSWGEWLSLSLDQPAWQDTSSSGNKSTGRAALPILDLRKIERYILQRVFELGWTTERFGKFDRTRDFDGIGRFATKESIGRKYQWIAYHEVLALISDHYQYRGYSRGVERSHRYVGPWQSGLRDIDPTLTATFPSGRPWIYVIDSSEVWWATAYDGWDDRDRLEDWLQRHDDLKKIEQILTVRHPDDGTLWLNCDIDLRWEQKPPVGHYLDEVEGGEVMCWINMFVMRAEDVRIFVDWFNAQSRPPLATGCDTEVYGAFVGEHGWAPAARYNQVSLENEHRGQLTPVHLEPVAAKYPYLAGPKDHSLSDYARLQLPVQKIVQLGGLRWNGHAADFLDSEGKIAAFDPSVYALGPSALLVREEFLRDMLHRHDLGIAWTVKCLKSLRCSGLPPGYKGIRTSGAYWLSETGPVGSMRPEIMRR